MMSEVEQRRRLVRGSYGRHGSQWINNILFFFYREKEMEDRKRKERVSIKLCVVF